MFVNEETGERYCVEFTDEEYDKYLKDPQARYSIGKDKDEVQD